MQSFILIARNRICAQGPVKTIWRTRHVIADTQSGKFNEMSRAKNLFKYQKSRVGWDSSKKYRNSWFGWDLQNIFRFLENVREISSWPRFPGMLGFLFVSKVWFAISGLAHSNVMFSKNYFKIFKFRYETKSSYKLFPRL